jgi:transposase
MHLNISKRKHGKIYLSIQKSYRDKKTKKNKTKTVKALGNLDELKKQYPDPVAHFKELAQKMTEEEKKEKRITLTISTDEKLKKNTNGRKNFGHAVILKIYHELEMYRFFNNNARHKNFQFNTNSIMMLLIVSRILYPGSKKKAFEQKDLYFERFNFSLEDVYRALSHFSNISTEAQEFLHFNISKKYGRNTKTIYYDVTNYYFQTDTPNDLKKYGRSKENRKNPIVQMGLAMDADGVPIHYELFPGNKLDNETFRSVIGKVRCNYNTGRIVVVADMGIITGDNIYYLKGGEKDKNFNGYIFSFSVRGGTKDFKSYVLDEDGYLDRKGKPVQEESDFKIKSRVIARDIHVTMTNGKKKKKTVYEKQVIFWAKKYADKARAERNKLIKKAMDLIANPTRYNRATSYGAASYVMNIEIDKQTGELLQGKKKPLFNHDKLAEDEKYDGYYSIVTSELDMSDFEIIDKYRGLWEIEESFKITKSELKSRPVFVRTDDHINAHFLICFIALTIIRLMQKKTQKKYSTAVIIDCLKKIACSNEFDNIYLFDYRSQISDAIGKAFDIDFTNKRLQLGDIKKILANTKK